MDLFWSASTTMRNPERTMGFLKTVEEIEGEVWDDDTQCKYQTLLIKNRYYEPTAKNLSDELYALITNYHHEMTYEEASAIFQQKRYVDPPMRGRTSFDPLEKLGLVSLDRNENGLDFVHITGFGRMFLNEDIDLGEMVFTSLLKTQFPNPLEDGRRDYNIKPFIGVLRLIRRVNERCAELGLNPVGISREEFGIFALTLKSYRDIERIAELTIDFRQHKHALPNDEERKVYVSNYISDYLHNFQNPHKNIKEYTDNIIRYLRLTKYIYIRGGGYFIDIEPRRLIEINAILAQDNGEIQNFNLEQYKQYISNYRAYVLPFETIESLTAIANQIINENNALSIRLGINTTEIPIPTSTDGLRNAISELRTQRAALRNLQIRREYQAIDNIDQAITALTNVLNRNIQGANRPSIELEKWANIALNILNDAVLIKPNAPLGDDNEPTFTAPANVPDIECYYDGFGAICEVTMLSGRDQWYNEGQPVMRHLRLFEQDNNGQENYCLFVAPRIHADTINTFWTAVKYEYEGTRQKIIPISITSLINILRVVRTVKASHRVFRKEDIRRLYDHCTNINAVPNSTRWQEHIGNMISSWATELA